MHVNAPAAAPPASLEDPLEQRRGYVATPTSATFRVLRGIALGGEAEFGAERLAVLYSKVTCPAAFARFAGVANCQTKLLISCSCGSTCANIGNTGVWNAAHTRALADTKRVLDAALFVALTEAFDLS